MSFEKAIEASLAAALGDDQVLLSELRGAFLDSAARHVEALREAQSDEDWRDAALRLKGLAASFGANALLEQAGRASRTSCGDRKALAGVQAELAIFAR